MANGVDKAVLCPFYRSTSPKEMKIRCEGVSEVCTTHLAFSSRADYKCYMDRHCCKRYWDCRIYWMLRGKYEDETP